MSDSGWEKHPHGIEICRYEKKSLGYGARIRVNGVTTELPYDTHLAVSALAAEVAELRKVLNWLVSDIREIAREQGISGAELYRNPCCGIGIHAFDTAVELLGLAQQKQEGGE